MSNTYLNRKEAGDLNKPQTTKFYAVKMIEDENSTAALQDKINLFLLAVPVAIFPALAHVVSIEYHNYPRMGNAITHMAFLTIFLITTLQPAPTILTIEAL